MGKRNLDIYDIIFVFATIIILVTIGIIAYGAYYDMTHECVHYKIVKQTRCNENNGYTRCWTEDVKVCDEYAK